MTSTTTPEFRLYESHELIGRDGYPEAWHESLKHLVREQAGDRCVRCGHPYERGAGEWSPCDELCKHGGPYNWRVTRTCQHGGYQEARGLDAGKTAGELVASGFHVEARWRILTVHHLDGNKANCRWWNLAALCQRCHLQIQGKVLMERVYPWPHSEWFKPYVAGYYAFVYLGEDLSRRQVWERMDELLGLELASPPEGEESET